MTSQPLAIITGAAGGLGTALCEILLSRRWAILAIDHNQKRLNQLAARHTAAPFYPLLSDLENPALLSLLDTALPTEHPVKALACIAAQSIGDDILHLHDNDWDRSFNVNVTPSMKLARYFAPRMAATGSGSIVNVGSPVGIVGARKPSYAASKAALSGLTISLARNLGPSGIRANLLLPGPMITPLTEDWSEEKRQSIAQGSFLKRLCQPREAANIIAFLFSEEASYITGSIIDATAGSMFGH